MIFAPEGHGVHCAAQTQVAQNVPAYMIHQRDMNAGKEDYDEKNQVREK
jgi:hypothetical protein